MWVKLNERKKSEELRELLGLEPVSLMIKKSRSRWFGHVEQKYDNDLVKRCITWVFEGVRQRRHPENSLSDFEARSKDLNHIFMNNSGQNCRKESPQS